MRSSIGALVSNIYRAVQFEIMKLNVNVERTNGREKKEHQKCRSTAIAVATAASTEIAIAGDAK